MEAIETLYDFRMITFTLGAIIPLLIYWYATRTHDYFKKRGIPYVKPPLFPLSLASPSKKPVQDVEVERYKSLGRVYGHFNSALSTTEPILTVGDPKLLKDILVRDFNNIPHRRSLNMEDEIASKMLTALRGEDWKRVRSIITPTFTTGKIKRVLGIFKDCSKALVQNFKMAIQKGNAIEVQRLYGAFTMDVIASSAFSTRIDSLNNPENDFVKAAKSIIVDRNPGIRMFLLSLLPKPLMKAILKIFPVPLSGVTFLKNVTLQIIAERKKTGQTRNDFLQLLIDAAAEASKEEKWEENAQDIAANYGDDASSHPVFKNITSKRLSVNELLAQCVIFFLAGYHTSALTLSCASYLLALNPDEQEKVFQELKNVLSETNGELTHEALQNMKYLDNVISETLRLYPPAIKIERIADKEFTLGDTGITISKDMAVQIPIYALHRDPEYHPDPDKFKPDRFSPEGRAQQVPFSYMPFGAGPRNCVGMRFALLEIKVCLAYILSVFQFKTAPETKIPLEFSPFRALSPKAIVLRLEIREDCPLKE